MPHPDGPILLIGDADGDLQSALAAALPDAPLRSVGGVFDGLAELAAGGDGPYAAVFAAVEPIERRPEPAVRALRDLAGDRRLILFGHPTLEPLSRKMLDFGGDDYVLTPADPAELRRLLAAPALRLAGKTHDAHGADDGDHDDGDVLPRGVDPADAPSPFGSIPIASIVLDALLHAPQASVPDVVARLGELLDASTRLTWHPATDGDENDAPAPDDDADGAVVTLAHPVAVEGEPGEPLAGSLRLALPAEADSPAARRALADVAGLLGKVAALTHRNQQLQRLAITDDLTGLHNGRYFRSFLDRILAKARRERFPVTLLLFDIDNFKQYNDKFGHGVGDEILRQTASLVKRCCRSHDLVARIAGDEFAVIFWENEAPRRPLEGPSEADGSAPASPTDAPRKPGFVGNQTPVQIAQRFRRLLNGPDFTALGETGRGTLTISGGMAMYPYDARDAAELIAAADEALMFGAKKQGKDAIYLVGGGAAGEGGA